MSLASSGKNCTILGDPHGWYQLKLVQRWKFVYLSWLEIPLALCRFTFLMKYDWFCPSNLCGDAPAFQPLYLHNLQFLTRRISPPVCSISGSVLNLETCTIWVLGRYMSHSAAFCHSSAVFLFLHDYMWSESEPLVLYLRLQNAVSSFLLVICIHFGTFHG